MQHSYLAAELRAVLAADPSFMWCPARSCRAGQLHDEGYIFTCGECARKLCTQCNLPWHADETCAEHGERVDEARRDAMLMNDPAEQARRRAAEGERLTALTRQLPADEAAVGVLAKLCPGCGRKTMKDGCVCIPTPLVLAMWLR